MQTRYPAIPLARALLAGLLVLALTACAPPVRTEHDETADFSQYQRFAWQAPEEGEVDDPELDSGMVDRRAERVISAALAASEYRQSEAGTADFLVTYHLVTRESSGGGSRFSIGMGGGNVGTGVSFGSGSSRELNLVIDILDAESGELVWRGWRNIGGADTLRDDEALRKQVDRILAAFPPEA